MGGAVARGLASRGKYNICVSDPSTEKLDLLKGEFPDVETTTDNIEATRKAEIPFRCKQVVSIAAGVTTGDVTEWLGCEMPVYYVIPNTAISIRRSMTFIAYKNADAEQLETVKSIFGELGTTLVIEEKQMKACMALASCGIAYAMRYVRANVEGAVELGISPSDATMITSNTMKGAAELLLSTGNHPEAEIDKVTTPGGLTIKGLNALEANGFTNAVIEALKASI